MLISEPLSTDGHLPRPSKLEDKDKEHKREMDAAKEKERHKEKYMGKSIQELDLSDCKRCTPSYRLLPADVYNFNFITFLVSIVKYSNILWNFFILCFCSIQFLRLVSDLSSVPKYWMITGYLWLQEVRITLSNICAGINTKKACSDVKMTGKTLVHYFVLLSPSFTWIL